jgi:uncharacterized protein (DUF2062 family)
MKPCIVIPCYNHPATVALVAASALPYAPVIVVDDGSTVKLPDLPGCTFLRLEKNSGKAAALRAGFKHAVALGYTNAITMDADGQHYAEDLPKFLELAGSQPNALGVGVRDLIAAGCPRHRQRSNAVSTFWFRVETGIRLGDTQCGFRCYPLALTQRIWTRSGRYAFELEFMVRAAWIDTRLVAVPVKCTYADGIRNSHFRPVKDLAHITLMNIGLVLQSWTVPKKLRVLWSFGGKESLGATITDFFTEHAHEPGRIAGAVGLGLFCGIAPFWGVQMLVAATIAHWLRLNKATTLLASNISIPPCVPFLVYGSTILGHWLFTGQILHITVDEMRAHWASHILQYIIGSFALGILAGIAGMIITYGIAKLARFAVARKNEI